MKTRVVIYIIVSVVIYIVYLFFNYKYNIIGCNKIYMNKIMEKQFKKISLKVLPPRFRGVYIRMKKKDLKKTGFNLRWNNSINSFYETDIHNEVFNSAYFEFLDKELKTTDRLTAVILLMPYNKIGNRRVYEWCVENFGKSYRLFMNPHSKTPVLYYDKHLIGILVFFVNKESPISNKQVKVVIYDKELSYYSILHKEYEKLEEKKFNRFLKTN